MSQHWFAARARVDLNQKLLALSRFNLKPSNLGAVRCWLSRLRCWGKGLWQERQAAAQRLEASADLHPEVVFVDAPCLEDTNDTALCESFGTQEKFESEGRCLPGRERLRRTLFAALLTAGRMSNVSKQILSTMAGACWLWCGPPGPASGAWGRPYSFWWQSSRWKRYASLSVSIHLLKTLSTRFQPRSSGEWEWWMRAQDTWLWFCSPLRVKISWVLWFCTVSAWRNPEKRTPWVPTLWSWTALRQSSDGPVCPGSKPWKARGLGKPSRQGASKIRRDLLADPLNRRMAVQWDRVLNQRLPDHADTRRRDRRGIEKSNQIKSNQKT